MLDDKMFTQFSQTENHETQAEAKPQENLAQEDNTRVENESSSVCENTEDTLKNEIAMLKDQLLRALAEAENIRRRSDREKIETSQYAVTKFARDMLNISDNLTRALEAIPTTDNQTAQPQDQHNSSALTNLIEGVRLTEKELLKTFENHGIKKIVPQGEIFDHNFHQVMFEIPTSEHAPGTIIQVLQAGYVLYDRLLRPAMVGVAKAADA